MTDLLDQFIARVCGWWDFIEEFNAPPTALRRRWLSPLLKIRQHRAAAKMAAMLRKE